MNTTESNRSVALMWFWLGAFFVVWTVWALLMVRFPVLENGVIRAIVRVLVWIVPACVFVLRVERESLTTGFALRDHWLRGLSFGLLGLLVIVGLTAVRDPRIFGAMRFRFDSASWLNAASTAPIAEEVVFRGLVLRLLLRRYSAAISLIISSALFAAIHLPFWWISNGALNEKILLAEGNVLILGCWFGLLYIESRSLWAPVLCHVMNNIFSIMLGL